MTRSGYRTAGIAAGPRLWLAGLAIAALAAQPVHAEGLLDSIDNEDIGRIVGGVGGAVLGSQFGKGTGKAVAVGAGALGGLFLGGEIGKQVGGKDQEAITQTRQQALDSDQPVVWRNPDSGVQSTARVTDTAYRPAPVVTTKQTRAKDGTPKNDVVWRVPPMQLVGADYRANTTSNVRGGPSTDYAVMGQLNKGETIHVVGKVVDKDWYMISRNGIGSGFVYGPLLQRIPGGGGDMARPMSTATLDNVRECSVIEQQVTLPNGTQETRRARACRTADGSWEMI